MRNASIEFNAFAENDEHSVLAATRFIKSLATLAVTGVPLYVNVGSTVAQVVLDENSIRNIIDSRPDLRRDQSLDRQHLADALHLMRHPKGDLWAASEECGCYDWANTLINRLHIVTT